MFCGFGLLQFVVIRVTTQQAHFFYGLLLFGMVVVASNTKLYGHLL